MGGPMFEAGLSAFALWQPVITNAPLQRRGLVFGYELETIRRMMFNPFTLQVDNVTCLMEGDRGSGKSATLKILFSLLLGLKVKEVDEDGTPMYFRGRTFSRKSSKNDEETNAEYHPEFETLAAAMHQPMYTLGYGAGLNLLSIFNKESDIIEFVMASIEMELGASPGPDVTNVIMVGVNKMVRRNRPEQISFGILNNTLNALTFEESEKYYEEYRQAVAQQFEQDATGLAMAVRQVKPKHIQESTEARFYEAKNLAMNCIHQILEGDYGGAFNGTTDLYDILSRRVQHIDLEALPHKGQALFEMALLRAQSNAIIAGKQDIGGGRNLLKTIPHFMGGDEEGIAVKNLAHLRSLALWMIRQRSFPTADFRTIQFGSQLSMAGDDKSEVRGLTTEIEQGFGYRMVFRQPDNNETLNRYRNLNMPEPFVQQIPKLKTGQMILWTKRADPVAMRINVPPSLKGVIQTDAAREMTNFVNREDEQAELKKQLDELRPHGTLRRQKELAPA